jgi:hypothetical protein
MNRPSKFLKSLLEGLCGLSCSCKQAGRLQSAALDRKLTLSERVGLRFHLVFCKWCRRYGKHISFLGSAAKNQVPENPQALPELSVEARVRLKRLLKARPE